MAIHILGFDFLVKKEFFPKAALLSQPQYCGVLYEYNTITQVISIKGITFSPYQLNYINWCPALMTEILRAAHDNFKTVEFINNSIV